LPEAKSEIVHELQRLDINFKAVPTLRPAYPKRQFALSPGCSSGEFYSDNLPREKNKSKLVHSLQGYQNGAVA